MVAVLEIFSMRGASVVSRYRDEETDLIEKTLWLLGLSNSTPNQGIDRLTGGNYEVQQYKGLILKSSYWRWPEQNQAGNAIDFYMKVLGLSFDQAMKELTGKR